MTNCGACDLGLPHFCEGQNQFIPKPWVDRSVPSENHSHDIVPWAVEERCYFCKYPASHKVEETNTNPAIHPLTAYVCCEHFWGFCHNTPDEPHTRGAETLDEVPERIKRKYGLHDMTIPKQVPSKRPDPTGPVADEDYANGHTYDRT